MATAEKVQYIIELTKAGDGAALAISDFRQVEAASDRANARIATGAALGSAAVKAGTKDIKTALSLIAITAFPQAAQAGIMFKGTMDLVRSSASGLGIGLTGLGVALIAIPVAATAAGYALMSLGEHVREVNKQMTLAQSNNNTFYSIIARIDQLEKGNKLTGEGAELLRKQANEAHKLKDNTAAQFEGLRKVYERLMAIEDVHKSVADISTAGNQQTLSGLARQLQILEDVNRKLQESIALKQKESGVNLELEAQMVEAGAISQRDAAIATLREQLILRAATSDIGARQLQLNFETSRTQLEITQAKEHGLITDEEALELQHRLNAAINVQQERIRMVQLEQNAYFQLAQQGVQSFAAGFSGAIVGALSGGKDAMREFFSQFFRQMAAAIIQTLLLKAVFSAISGVGGGSSSAISLATSLTNQTTGLWANGGVRFAANGIQTVAQPTYFPRFNVVAGEAGAEMLTVLAKPRMMDVGGLAAAVGNAGASRLAITSASELEQRVGGRGGKMHIQVSLEPGLKVRIVNEAADMAEVRVGHALTQDSTISRNVKGLVS